MTSLYLGLDSGTQGLTGILVEADEGERRIVWQHTIGFDELGYGTRHGVLPRADPLVATSSPVMWADALDQLMATLSADCHSDLRSISAICGSGQQHGSVYLNVTAGDRLARLDPVQPLAPQVQPMLSRPDSPIWMDSSTSAECRAITGAVGGAEELQRLTGSRAFERFTGPQIKRFAERDPAAYAATDRIHLVSSFLASLLIGEHAPLDPGDAAGMNLMNIQTRQWSGRALDATARGLFERLPPIASPDTVIGTLSPYWTTRHHLPAARVVAWTGDNPASAVGVGLVDDSCLAISLGTSDTVFGVMQEVRLDHSGAANVFSAATGGYLGLVCFKNGSLAREHVRDAYQLDWAGFGELMLERPPGNAGAIMLPWFDAEITPHVLKSGVWRFGFDRTDPATNVRAVVEAQMLAAQIHSAWMGTEGRVILATGGGATNRAILQVMADVFGSEVHQLEVSDSAALGSALRALYATRLADGRPLEWPDVVRGAVRPVAYIHPDARNASMYREMRTLYRACELHALGQGSVPA